MKKTTFYRSSLFLVGILGGIITLILYIKTNLLSKETYTNHFTDMIGHSCDALLLNPSAWFFGIPIAGYGLIYFAFLGFLFSILNSKTRWIAFYTSTFVAGLNIALLTSYFYSFIVPCSYFILINLLIITIPILVIKAFNLSLRSLPYYMNGYGLLISITIGFILGIIIIQFGPINKEKNRLDDIWQTYLNQPIIEIPNDSLSPFYGLESAPVKLYVFSSFQCPYCKVFAYSLQYLQKQHPSKLATIFKHFPLSSQCNPAIKSDMQPLACNAAIASVIAQEQNKFWAFHDKIFASDLSFEYNDIEVIFQELNLDMKYLEEEIDARYFFKRISNDIILAQKLNVEGTPTVFINDREAPAIDLISLEYIISQLLD